MEIRSWIHSFKHAAIGGNLSASCEHIFHNTYALIVRSYQPGIIESNKQRIWCKYQELKGEILLGPQLGFSCPFSFPNVLKCCTVSSPFMCSWASVALLFGDYTVDFKGTLLASLKS